MSPTRAEQRAATEQRILRCARELFAREGFERTTVRAVAATAGVDPALVMQYFGSKQGLFTASVRAAPEPEFRGDPAELAAFLTETMRLKLTESEQEPMAMLRSMLTHPDATRQARETLERQNRQIASALETPDAQIRAAIATALMLGVRLGRELLGLPSLAGIPVDELLPVLSEVFAVLTRGTDSGTTRRVPPREESPG